MNKMSKPILQRLTAEIILNTHILNVNLYKSSLAEFALAINMTKFDIHSILHAQRSKKQRSHEIRVRSGGMLPYQYMGKILNIRSPAIDKLATTYLLRNVVDLVSFEIAIPIFSPLIINMGVRLNNFSAYKYPRSNQYWLRRAAPVKSKSNFIYVITIIFITFLIFILIEINSTTYCWSSDIDAINEDWFQFYQGCLKRINLNYEQIALTNNLVLFYTNPNFCGTIFHLDVIQYNVKYKFFNATEPKNLEMLLNDEIRNYSHIYTIDSLEYIGIFFYREAHICTMSSFCIKKNESLISMQKGLKNFMEKHKNICVPLNIN